ncbi:MAG: DUF2442 domain-containing protein [Propionivibrio sp.]
MTPDVTHAQALPGYELLVTFADGEKRRFSMLPYLDYPAYQPLQEPQKFALAHVANGTVAWNDEIDMSPDTLYIAGSPVKQ